MSEKNTMTRNAMLFCPPSSPQGVLLMAMSSLYSHILTKSAVGLFNATNMMVNFTFLLIAAWMSTPTPAMWPKSTRKTGLPACSRPSPPSMSCCVR